jgi:DNA-binding SARP family transcriptional activator/tetratricopeptide (TPR) repeat protein
VLRLNFMGEQRVNEQGSDSPSLVVGRALELLARLVVNAGTPQERERLAGQLWPESSSQQARTNLRRELHGLRQLAGIDGSIHSDGTALLWRDGSSCTADVLEFRHNRTLALRCDRDGNSAGLLHHGWAAIDGYKGELLPGLYSDWVLEERESLRRGCVELCDRLAAAAANSQPERALAAAQRRVQLEPLEETGYQMLMELQSAAGDAAAAVRTYHRCSALLEQELGIEPGTHTRHLARRLLGFTPEPRPAGGRAVMVMGPGPAAGRPVGREREENILWQRWNRAGEGMPGLLLVTGDAGVGKTRLLLSLLAGAKARGAVTAYSRCFAGVGQIALSPVAAWLGSADFRSISGYGRSPWNVELARLLPNRSHVHGRRGGVAATPLEEGSALVEAWRRRAFHEALVRTVLAPGRPTLLVLDDLQWCDEETLNWMGALFSQAAAAPLLIAATVRPDELAANASTAAGVEALRAAQWVQEVPLSPLDAASSAELAASVLDRPLSDAEAPLVHAATGGYPLLLVEMARGMRGASLDELLGGAGDGQGVLNRRFEQCSAKARAAAALAAAVGREFSLELLGRAWDGDERSLVCAVDELWRRRILREQRGGYDFSHDLLRQCAYELEPPAQRWLLHRRLAQAIEALHPGGEDGVAAQLAEQYRRAGDVDLAMGYYVQAGDAATRIFANARAVADYQSGLDLLAGEAPGVDTRDRELEMLLRMPPPLTALRGYSSPQLRSTLERIIELAGGLGRTRVLAAAMIGLFAATFVQGHTVLSHELAARALGLAQDMPDLLGQANFAVGGAATSLGRTAAAIRHFDLACAQAPDTTSNILGTRIEVHARAWSSHAHWLAGDDDGALALAVEAVDRATRAGHPYSLAVALAYGAVLLQMRMGHRDAAGNGPDELARRAAELESLCTRYNFAYYGHWGSILRGWAGGGEQGLEAIRHGIGELAASLAFARMPYWQSLLAQALVASGRPEDARAVLAAAESAAYQRDDMWWLPEVLRLHALLVPRPAARLLLARAQAMAGEQGSITLAGSARATAALIG